ncbi:S8 family serine peptidase [Pseudoalteromonas sp. SWN29]|uniref:S8 family serine peptidase n=1 Tax=Pseudoalteromonas sp. SWN29 TaxID=2792064 RepID=UPI0018CD9B79|nr:S8 family serine peptidase [Pseudoalteromonas sp. SWN29]MBH0027556.1 S8 family serine peptidase [Pseudoalteromonas sp. SWN29]
MKNYIVLPAILMLSTPLMASVTVDNMQVESGKVKQKPFNLIVTFKDKNIHNSLLLDPKLESVLKKEAQLSSMSLSSVKYKYNVSSAIDTAYGTAKMISLSNDHNLKFSHQRSMALGADLIKVNTLSSLEAQQLVLKLLASGDFENVMIDTPVSKQNYNDPYFDKQIYFQPRTLTNHYGQDYVKMRELTVNNLGRKIRIGVADTGYFPHEDIGELIEGYDFVTSEDALLAEPEIRDNDPTDLAFLADGTLCHDGHGLSVAGLIAAESNNGVGVTGAVDSNNVEMVYSRVLDCFGNGNTSNTLDAVAWMSGESVPGVPDIKQKVDVINLSLGGSSATGCDEYRQAIYSKARESGVVVVVAAGNSNTDAETFLPAACNDVITVGATEFDGSKASFSNFGEHIDVMAAGSSVWMLSSDEFSEQLYFRGSGTSMATPNIVAGVSNLLLTYNHLTPLQVEEMLIANGQGYTHNSLCGQLGCGSGAVDMGNIMDAIPSLPTINKYTKVHRYEDYNSEDKTQWLTQMDKFTNVCNTVKYTWGQLGGITDNITYKLYMLENDKMVYKETVNSPQKIYDQTLDIVVGVQACSQGACGNIVQMSGPVSKPNYCNTESAI